MSSWNWWLRAIFCCGTAFWNALRRTIDQNKMKQLCSYQSILLRYILHYIVTFFFKCMLRQTLCFKERRAYEKKSSSVAEPWRMETRTVRIPSLDQSWRTLLLASKFHTFPIHCHCIVKQFAKQNFNNTVCKNKSGSVICQDAVNVARNLMALPCDPVLEDQDSDDEQAPQPPSKKPKTAATVRRAMMEGPVVAVPPQAVL